MKYLIVIAVHASVNALCDVWVQCFSIGCTLSFIDITLGIKDYWSSENWVISVTYKPLKESIAKFKTKTYQKISWLT